MAKTLCKIGGVVLLIVGVVGFLAPHLLGMHLTLVHNVIHLLSGGLAAWFGFQGSPRAAAQFCIAFGAVYGVVALLGFVAPGLLATVLGHPEPLSSAELMPDNVVHVLLSLTFLIVGIVSVKKPG